MVTVHVFTVSPRIVVNGLSITTAPVVSKLHVVLGQPDRIDTGPVPAPYGHRNNQIHVYDRLGVTFNEHHYTRRAQDIWCWFDTSELVYRFTPKEPFLGKLFFNETEIPLGGSEQKFMQSSPFKFQHTLGHVWSFRFEGFSLRANERGQKLPSGRRSRKRQVTDISISWPHDDWASPAI